jgi:hypothetical protein
VIRKSTSMRVKYFECFQRGPNGLLGIKTPSDRSVFA